MKARDEPNMSDTTILTSVEDLINIAMGAPNKNVVNFKMVQAVLHILARQLRMLETHVEVRISERSPSRQKRSGESTSESSSSKSPSRISPVKQKLGGHKDEAGRKAADKQRAERATAKEMGRTVKDREKAEREAVKGQEKLEKASAKEKEREEKASSKERSKADKDQEKSARGQEKVEKSSAKEREKEERAAAKEQTKSEKTAVKEREKEDKERGKSAKEKDKAESAAAKEMEKADRATAKEKEIMAKEYEKADKMAGSEKDKSEREVEREKRKEVSPGPKSHQRDKGKQGSATSIAITEVERQKQKVLVVEKGPTTRTDARARIGSIEVVTLSQFEILEAAVQDLKVMAAPLPSPVMPDNHKLLADITSGGASLTEVMQAMQVTARVQAAEMAIGRMAGLITELAASGAIPDEFVGMVEDIRKDGTAIGAPVSGTKSRAAILHKSVAIDPISSQPTRTDEGGQSAQQTVAGRPSVASSIGGQSMVGGPRPSVASARRPSVISRQSGIGMGGVTRNEMNDALHGLKEDLTKNMNNLISKAATVADTAAITAKAVAEKLDIALKLNIRISSLYSLVSDYAEQLGGFDSGLTTQMLSFQEQMSLMRSDLKDGLTQLEQANNNAETAAVLELTERYDGLVTDLDHTLHTHQGLISLQQQFADELRGLVECVEMLREQKADRDEVLDGLRDKADISRLAGLLTDSEFALSRIQLERRLDLCYDKFNKQEQVWIRALKELSVVSESKAEATQLAAARDDAQRQLRDQHAMLHVLADTLGEPKAAMLTRKLARDATCGACQVPALMLPADAHYGAPPALPALPSHPSNQPLPLLLPRPRPAGAETEPPEPCLAGWQPPEPSDKGAHACRRWVGGSHTLLSGAVTRERAPPHPTSGVPCKRYAGFGTDGRLYMLEEELQPCIECNILSTDKKPDDEELGTMEGDPVESGAGDQGGRRSTNVVE